MKLKPRAVRALVAATLAVASLGGCATQASVVNRNVSIDADNFKVARRIAVINTRTDKPLFEVVGNFSISNSNDELVVTVKVADNQFKKHFIYLGPNVAYIVEDITGATVSPYQYEVNYIPEQFIPFKFKSGS